MILNTINFEGDKANSIWKCLRLKCIFLYEIIFQSCFSWSELFINVVWWHSSPHLPLHQQFLQLLNMTHCNLPHSYNCGVPKNPSLQVHYIGKWKFFGTLLIYLFNFLYVWCTVLTLSIGQHLCEIIKMGHSMHIKGQLITLLIQIN